MPDAFSGGWDLLFSDYRSEQLFALVSDIESYPQFVPGCLTARIVERQENRWQVDQTFGFGPLQSRFRSEARINPPHGLEVTASDGPWRHFQLSWRLTEEGGGCRLFCRFSAEFRSPLLAAAAHLGRAEMDRRIIAAFERRASALFG